MLTFLFPFSLGTFTMMVNTLMFGLQAVILGRDFERVQLLQLPSALLFSACHRRVEQAVFLLAGCALI